LQPILLFDFLDFRKAFFIGYGDGSAVSGELYTDTVQIEALTATRQTIGAATQYTPGFQLGNFPADGLMGEWPLMHLP
jgi:cathepsin D